MTRRCLRHHSSSAQICAICRSRFAGAVARNWPKKRTMVRRLRISECSNQTTYCLQHHPDLRYVAWSIPVNAHPVKAFAAGNLVNRSELQELSKLRLREASSLLRAQHYAGAYYLAGYAVECALKACVAKQVRQHDFPDKTLANQAWTHNLEQLVKTAGLWPDLQKEMDANKHFELNWTVTKDWSENSRYDLSVTAKMARDLYSAITAQTSGVVPWIRKRW